MLTIAYMTNRPNPCFRWFVDSLCNELAATPTECEVVFVDAWLWPGGEARRNELAQIVGGRLNYRHTPPKPTVWQGPTRLTTQDYFAASNARNTALLLARGDYIVFVDDLSVLLPGWMSQVRHAQQHRYCVGGSYKKMLNLVVENGRVVSFTDNPKGVDSRWPVGSDGGIVAMDGGGLYGCSCGVPMEYAERCNGYEELCDGMGSEDTDFGIRVERAGCRIFYNRNMCTYESEELHAQEPVAKRVIKKTPGTGFPDQSHIMLHRVRHEPRITTIQNYYNLAEVRKSIAAGGSFPEATQPTHHWPDNQPLSEM